MDVPNEEKDIERCLGTTVFLGISFDELEHRVFIFFSCLPIHPLLQV
jgi:hypothetical protein